MCKGIICISEGTWGVHGLDLAELRAVVDRGHLLRGLEMARTLADDRGRPIRVRLEALLVACRCAAGRELYAEGYGYAQRALGLAEVADLPEQVTLAHHHAGYTMLRAGDPSGGEIHILKALAGLDLEPSLSAYLPDGLYNLGMCWEQQRRYLAALDTYRKAAEIYEEQGRPVLAILPWLNAAWVALRAERQDDAAICLGRAGALLDSSPAQYRTEHMALSAALAYRRGDRDTALGGAEEILVPGRTDISPWAHTLAGWVAGSVATDNQQHKLADVFCRAAASAAPLCRDTALMNLVCALKKRIHADVTDSDDEVI